MKGIVISVIAAMLLATSFFCVDCCAGLTRYFQCAITAHHYVPSHTEITTTTDANGNAQIDTTFYPEEFHLICSVVGDGEAVVLDVNGTRSQYYALTNGQAVTVRTKQGIWTGKQWIPTIIQ